MEQRGLGALVKRSGLARFVIVFVVLFFSVSSLVVLGQYQTQQTTNVALSADGTAHIDQSATAGGVSIDICGDCGATGSVSTAIYNANPQPDASVPAGTTLTHFVAIAFNFAVSDFQNASITIHYSDSDVAGMTAPIVLLKYDTATNSFVALNAVVDTSAKTITTVVTSLNDPLFAIGGTATTTSTPTNTKSSSGPMGEPWAFWLTIPLIIVVIAILSLLINKYRNNHSKDFVVLPVKT
jgi:hypothetical protein